MPVLEFANGKTIGQSLAISNYVAKLAGAYPMDPMLALKNESLTNDFADYLGDFSAPVFAPHKPELVDVILTKTIDSWAQKIEKALAENRKKFLIGDKLYSCDYWAGHWYVSYINNPVNPWSS